MKPSGAHTHPGMGGGPAVALVVVAAILAAAIAGPVAQAVGSLLHVVVDIVEIGLIAIGSAVGLVGLLGLVYVAGRLHLRYRAARRAVGYPEPRLVIRQQAEQVAEPEEAAAEIEDQAGPLPAIEPPRQRLWQPPTGL